MSPSSSASSMPVTGAVWGTFQFAAVNVRPAGATLPSVGSALESPIETSAVGWLVSRTVNEAGAPGPGGPRAAARGGGGPATLLSVFVTATSAGSCPEYFASPLAAAARTIV